MNVPELVCSCKTEWSKQNNLLQIAHPAFQNPATGIQNQILLYIDRMYLPLYRSQLKPLVHDTM